MPKLNIKSNQGVNIYYQLRYLNSMIISWSDLCWHVLDSCWTNLDSCSLVSDSCWFVLTRVGLVLICVDSCWTCVDWCWSRVDSCWLVLIRVDLCWYSCIRIDLISFHFHFFYHVKFFSNQINFKKYRNF